MADLTGDEVKKVSKLVYSKMTAIFVEIEDELSERILKKDNFLDLLYSCIFDATLTSVKKVTMDNKNKDNLRKLVFDYMFSIYSECVRENKEDELLK